MKKSFILVITVILLLSSTSHVYARNENSTRSSELKKQFHQEIKTERKELREERKASMSAEREEFKQKLGEIKDERKQIIVQKFVDKMNRVNQRRVDHWKKILARLSEILSLITAKLGSDNPAVQIANEKLAAAQAAVDTQSAKEYTMNVSSESALKSNAGFAMSQEQSDLRQILILVNEARKAVHDALRTLKQGNKVPEATPSATPTASPSATPAV